MRALRSSQRAPVTRLDGVRRAGVEIRWDLLGDRSARLGDLGRVSCLCVTRGRLQCVARALRCFQAQTYANRELVVVHEELEAGALELLAAQPNVTLVHVPTVPKQPLGTLRNIAIEASRGAYLLGWDDDDWYPPRRIELQLHCLSSAGADAATLARWLILDETNGKAYLSPRRVWEGSLLLRRDLPIVAEGYPALARAEDLHFVDRLREQHELALLDRPELYVYTYHGANTWERAHFRGIFRMAAQLSTLDAKRIRAALE